MRTFKTVLITDSIMKHIPEDALGTNHTLKVINRGDSDFLEDKNVRRMLLQINPDYIYIHLGINDICGRNIKTNTYTLRRFGDFSLFVEQYLPNTRIIYSLPLRTNNSHVNKIIQDLSDRLLDCIEKFTSSLVLYNANSNFVRETETETAQVTDLFANDGIHLSTEGKKRILGNFRHVIHDLTRKILNKPRRPRLTR